MNPRIVTFLLAAMVVFTAPEPAKAQDTSAPTDPSTDYVPEDTIAQDEEEDGESEEQDKQQ